MLLLPSLQLAGSVALLLWGTHMVQSGVLRAFGMRLREVLNRALRNRVCAFLAGAGVTALLQSSTATALMVSGFAADGLLDLVPALAVMLGANVGTTLVVDLLTFDVATVTPMLVLVGLVMFRRTEAGLHHLGRVLIGLGLMFTALRQLLDVVAPLEQLADVHLIGLASAQPLLDVVFAAGLAWAAHSSVAVVLLIMSLAAKGIISTATADALVLGANLGTAFTPVLQGAAAIDPAARRLPLGNLLNRVVGVGLVLPLLTPIVRLMDSTGLDPSRAVAAFHTLFNASLAMIFLPNLSACSALLRRLVPLQHDAAGRLEPLYAGPGTREPQVETLEEAVGEVLRLADILDAILRGLRLTLKRVDRTRVAEIRQLESMFDELYHWAVAAYLAALDRDGSGNPGDRHAMELLTFATNLKSACVVITRQLLVHAVQRIEVGLPSSDRQHLETLDLIDRLLSNLRATTTLFVTRDVPVARLLAADKEAFRLAEMRATAAFADRLLEGRIRKARPSSLQLDLLRDMARVNAHLIAAAAYPVLEAQDELLPTRLRQILTEG